MYAAGERLRLVDQIEKRHFARQRDPGEYWVVLESQAGLRVHMSQQCPRRIDRQLAESWVKKSRRPAAGWQQTGNGDSIPGPKSSLGLKLERDIDPARLECGDQMIEPGECFGIERLGVIASVVEQTAIGTQGRIEFTQPNQVDPRAGQSVDESVRLFGRQKCRGREHHNSKKPCSPSVFTPRQPPVLDGDESQFSGWSKQQKRYVESHCWPRLLLTLTR